MRPDSVLEWIIGQILKNYKIKGQPHSYTKGYEQGAAFALGKLHDKMGKLPKNIEEIHNKLASILWRVKYRDWKYNLGYAQNNENSGWNDGITRVRKIIEMIIMKKWNYHPDYLENPSFLNYKPKNPNKIKKRKKKKR